MKALIANDKKVNLKKLLKDLGEPQCKVIKEPSTWTEVTPDGQEIVHYGGYELDIEVPEAEQASAIAIIEAHKPDKTDHEEKQENDRKGKRDQAVSELLELLSDTAIKQQIKKLIKE